MIQAIETRYAGHHFRSRLEARWAVAFDHLGIEWQYEAQGYMCDYRVSLQEPVNFPYLPDFWLPREKCFVEVKGSLRSEELLGILDRAASLCDRTDARFILAGPIPDLSRPRVPVALSMRKGCLLASPGLMGGVTADGQWEPRLETMCVAHDVGGDLRSVTRESCDSHVPTVKAWVTDPLSTGSPTPHWTNARLLSAYAAAHSARFEHGASGAT